MERGEPDAVVFDISSSTKRLDDVAGKVTLVRGDLGDFAHVLNVVHDTKPTAIYNVGGMLSLRLNADPSAAIRANASGTFHVLEAAKLFDVRQVLFTSSLATYGLDIREGRIDDYTLQRPQLFYGATKVFFFSTDRSTSSTSGASAFPAWLAPASRRLTSSSIPPGSSRNAPRGTRSRSG